jgi:hypothetical protein
MSKRLETVMDPFWESVCQVCLHQLMPSYTRLTCGMMVLWLFAGDNDVLQCLTFVSHSPSSFLLFLTSGSCSLDAYFSIHGHRALKAPHPVRSAQLSSAPLS